MRPFNPPLTQSRESSVSERLIRGALAGVSVGVVALTCKLVGFSPVEQAWAALTLIMMIRETQS